MFRPRSGEHPDDETSPGLLMVRVEGRIFFANAEQIQHKIKLLVDETHPKIVALHVRGVPDLEFSALKMPIEAEKRNRERGIRLWLVGVNPEVLDMIRRSPLSDAPGPDAMHFNLEIAVAKFAETMGSAEKPCSGIGLKGFYSPCEDALDSAGFYNYEHTSLSTSEFSPRHWWKGVAAMANTSTYSGMRHKKPIGATQNEPAFIEIAALVPTSCTNPVARRTDTTSTIGSSPKKRAHIQQGKGSDISNLEC